MRHLTLLLVLTAAVLAGCGSTEEPAAPGADESLVSDAGPQHVHGLGINPADGDLYIATHMSIARCHTVGTPVLKTPSACPRSMSGSSVPSTGP